MVTKGNVLVVDDEINLCRILGAKLAKSGYTVVAVHDGLQAVEKIRETEFDVVLLDLILPTMDGLTALAEIRGMRSGLPVIVMTASENAEAMAQAKSLGVSAYVNKPFDLDNLVALISNTSIPHESTLRRSPNATVLFCKDQPVTLEIACGLQAKNCLGWIHDKDDRTLSVLVPRRDDEVGEILPKNPVKVGLAAMDAYYSFTTHVLKIIEITQRILMLDKPGVIYRAQRRQHPRLPINMPVTYGVCDDDVPRSFKECETMDISLGGLCLAMPEEALPGDMIHLELHPDGPQSVIHANAQVVRSIRSCDSDKNYIVACKFTSVDDSFNVLFKN
ncbi:MAG: response regulator [Armatimonadetes bacterium]|nr:response regulator [Armatimonadota bacterium]